MAKRIICMGICAALLASGALAESGGIQIIGEDALSGGSGIQIVGEDALSGGSGIQIVGEDARADDTGIQIIGEPEMEVVRIDDFQPGDVVPIEGYAKVELDPTCFTSKITTDGHYDPASDTWYRDASLEAGEGARYLRLDLQMWNLHAEPFDFMPEFGDVVCSFGDGYRFKGWVRQLRLIDNHVWIPYESGDTSEELETMGWGRFMIAVTLPDYAVESEEPLSVTFTIGENEFTYHHR